MYRCQRTRLSHLSARQYALSLDPSRRLLRITFTSRFYSAAAKSLERPGNARFSEIGIQHLSDHVHAQIFPASTATPTSPHLVRLSQTHLTQHDLLGKNQDSPPPVSFDLPPLQGKSLDEHFWRLAMVSASPYLDNATHFAHVELPPRPITWIRRSGWTKYNSDGTTEAVEAPDEDMLTFDTEVLYKETSFACMACAASPSAWYAWLSPWLLGESKTDRHLIPLGDPSRSRIIVGHNIGYDRARVREEYSLQQSNNFFIDTMSIHVAVNGMCSRQRPTWMKHKKDRELRDEIAKSDSSVALNSLLESGYSFEEEAGLWVDRSSINSLRDVAHFHCGVVLDKTRREWFGVLDRDGVMEKLNELLDYCAADVSITHQVYCKVFPAFRETCPHPVSFAALRHLSAAILPVNKAWETYIAKAEATYQKLSEAVTARLVKLAERALKLKSDPEKYQNDPWLSQLDWSGQEVRMVKPKKKGDAPQPAARQKMPGMPQWYKDLFATSSAPINLTVRSRISPLLLRLSWDSYPLVWSMKHGFMFKVPYEDVAKLQEQGVQPANMEGEADDAHLLNDHNNAYFKLPHKNGPHARCASPLAKGYLAFFEQGKLTSEFSYAKQALEMNASCSYWISARDRIMSQMVVYADELDDPEKKPRRTQKSVGFIIPQIVPMGTITRRAVENTWLTASNAKVNRVGSELKSMVTAPEGYCFVGADVDSEELWIASLVGDAQFKLHGGNALGFMTLEGTKAAGTDLHSRTAKILGISRNDAKIFNYGRIYGAGQRYATQLLRQFNSALNEEQANRTSATLYAETKGKRCRKKAVHGRAFWRGGTESFVFNRLEDLAEQERPRTPVLGAGITEALQQRHISKGEFLTSRINWAIQSSGVDYLHLLLVAMDYLIRRFGLQARIAITVHDEIRYLVKEEDKYRAAMALQVANVWTRAMFSQQLGIDDLPQACAYFSAIDIDHVLRKEVDLDCITPSHPKVIPPGESVDIMQLLQKGELARLDAGAEDNVMARLQAFAYAPRPRVIQSLEQEGDEAYVAAQISANDVELKQLLKILDSPSKKTATPTTTTRSRASRVSKPNPLPHPESPMPLSAPPRLQQRAGMYAASPWNQHQITEALWGQSSPALRDSRADAMYY